MSGISPNSHKGQVTVTGNQDKQEKLNKQLIQAVISDDFFKVRRILYKKVNVNAKDLAGKTALHHAVEKNDKKIIKELLDRRADINAKDLAGKTALHYAVEMNDKKIIKELLDRGADVNAKDSNGYTALHTAVYYGYREIVELLLEKGSDVNVTDRFGRTPLQIAESHGFEEIVLFFERRSQEKTAIKDKKDKKILNDQFTDAVDKNNIDAILYLIEKGAGNTRNSDGFTALSWTIICHHEEAAQMLLGNRVDVNNRDKFKQTALLWAVRYGQLEMVKTLVNAGADINAADYDGRTALLEATQIGHEEIVELLLDKGADVNARDSVGWTAVQLAAKKVNVAIVEKLVVAGANVDNFNSSKRIKAAISIGKITLTNNILDSSIHFNNLQLAQVKKYLDEKVEEEEATYKATLSAIKIQERVRAMLALQKKNTYRFPIKFFKEWYENWTNKRKEVVST